MGWRGLVGWIWGHFGRRRKPQVAQLPPGMRGEHSRGDSGESGAGVTMDTRGPTRSPRPKVRNGSEAARTQFSKDRTEPTDLVIGLDFGTLSTRCVVRSPTVGAGRAVPVQWPGVPTHHHFLPAAVRQSEKGEFTLTADWSALDTDGNLKTDLMDHPEDVTVRARAAAYLGLALREVRGYLLDTQRDAYGQYRLRWAVHLGIPSTGYEDGDKVKTAFLRVGRAAWMLSRCSDAPTLDTARAALDGAENTTALKADPDLTVVEVYPEIAALVVGYARSSVRRDGPHVMVDVGASTIDVCGFGLRDDDGDDEYLLYSPEVSRSGIRELHRQRLDAIKNADAEHSPHMVALLDPFSVVPSAGRLYLSTPVEPLRGELDLLDNGYVGGCANALMRVLMELRRQWDPNSHVWTTGLPLFKTGGGAQHELIARVVQEAHWRFTAATDAKGIEERVLPTLQSLVVDEDSSRDLAGRLGVAYGLSFDNFEFGVITPEREIDKVPPMPLRPPAECPSKDQV